MTGCIRPPKKLRNSSTRRRCAAVRRNRRREDVRVADLLHATDGLFRLEPIHHRLHRCVGRPVLLGQGFLNLPDGRIAQAPERLHDPEFDLAEFWQRHARPPIGVDRSTTCVVY